MQIPETEIQIYVFNLEVQISFQISFQIQIYTFHLDIHVFYMQISKI